MSYIIPSLLVSGQKHGKCGCWGFWRYVGILWWRSRSIPQRWRQLWHRCRQPLEAYPRRRRELNKRWLTGVSDVEDYDWWLELFELHLGHRAGQSVWNGAGHHEADSHKDLREVVLAKVCLEAGKANDHTDQKLMSEVQKRLSHLLGELVSGLLLETVSLD